ncbi:aspartyl/glutamyl-tRNA amidotransferase subunit A [Patescibacteria group bacterium]|nr:aspartyl/glutamyl-tRNA amidotransferase subunit A [Patescibacteria group bacterium]
MELNKLTIKEASEGLKKGEFTSVDLTKACLERIKEVDKKINAFLLVDGEGALKAAAESDKRRKEKKSLGQLDGIPYALKDVFCVEGMKTTAASKILEDFIPPYSATVYEKLRDAGAVLLGKVNTDEFTMGSSTENSAFGVTKNPWDLTRVSGGSSGGSAAAVAADECLFALGTDTGGSIRQPASFCSTVGLKVTYGLVSRYGVMSYASSFDTIGPLAKSTEDIAIILNTIAGYDEKDGTSVPYSSRESRGWRDESRSKELGSSRLARARSNNNLLPDYTKSLNKDIKEMKIGLPKEFFGKGIESEVRRVIEKAIEDLKKMGVKIEETSLPSTKYAIAIYYIIAKSEASSNLSRYDGIKYGMSAISKQPSANSKLDLRSVYTKTRGDGFGPEAKRSIMLGTYTLSAGYYDAYYKKASQVRTLIKEEYEELFKKFDLLISPVSPTPSFKIGEKIDDPLTMYLSDVLTVPINPAGIPAVSVPAGFTKDGLPVGLQIMGPMLGEPKILQLARSYEEINKWYKRKPNL